MIVLIAINTWLMHMLFHIKHINQLKFTIVYTLSCVFQVYRLLCRTLWPNPIINVCRVRSDVSARSALKCLRVESLQSTCGNQDPVRTASILAALTDRPARREALVSERVWSGKTRMGWRLPLRIANPPSLSDPPWWTWTSQWRSRQTWIQNRYLQWIHWVDELLKEYPKMKICWKCAHPQVIQG